MRAPVILFTRHARLRLAQRNIIASWVEVTLRSPDWVEPDPSGADVRRFFRRVPELGGQFLRVVAAMDGKDLRVLTAFPDRDAVPPAGE